MNDKGRYHTLISSTRICNSSRYRSHICCQMSCPWGCALSPVARRQASGRVNAATTKPVPVTVSGPFFTSSASRRASYPRAISAAFPTLAWALPALQRLSQASMPALRKPISMCLASLHRFASANRRLLRSTGRGPGACFMDWEGVNHRSMGLERQFLTSRESLCSRPRPAVADVGGM
jgi:hypothetical protein